MPTYEYACKSCGQHLEVVQSFSDDALTTCPACAGSLRKVFGNIGISFKGSGFYKNDSRSSTRSGSSATSSDGSAGGSSSSESSSSESTTPAKEAASSKDSPSSGKESAPAAKESGGAAKPAPSKPAAAAS
jgi:putative FmdB family regulatory protein